MRWIARLAIHIGVLGLLLGLAACRHTDPCPYGAEGFGFDIELRFWALNSDKNISYATYLRSRGLMDSTDRFSNYLMGYFVYNDSLIPCSAFYGSNQGVELFRLWNDEYLHPQNPNWGKERWYRYGDTITDTLLIRFVYDCPEETDTFFVSYIPEPDPNPECPSRHRLTISGYQILHKSVFGEFKHQIKRDGGLYDNVNLPNVVLPCEP